MMERRCSFLVVTAGKPAGEIKARLVTKNAQRADAGAVFLADAVVKDMLHQVEILFHPQQPPSHRGMLSPRYADSRPKV